MNLDLSIPTSLGEIINIKYNLDQIKHKYNKIRINFNTRLWNECLHTEAADWHFKKSGWDRYLYDLGKLFFSESPYEICNGNFRFYHAETIRPLFGMSLQIPRLGKYLCAGKSLNLDEEYIVITTKVRNIDKRHFFPLSIKLWKTIRQISSKYKVVILGERRVELRKEYGNGSDIFGVYDQIISNISNDRIVDLTVSSLGNSVSTVQQIQQDCLIMKEAKFVITLGIGGNVCMAVAAESDVVGFRYDNDIVSNDMYRNEYPNMVITKDFEHFIKTIVSK